MTANDEPEVLGQKVVDIGFPTWMPWRRRFAPAQDISARSGPEAGGCESVSYDYGWQD